MNRMSFEEWNEKYCNDKVIDLNKYLNKKDYEIFNKLDISLENKVYTLLEYDIIKQKLFEYYTDKEQEEYIASGMEIPVKSLEEKNVKQEDYDKLLNKFMKIYEF